MFSGKKGIVANTDVDVKITIKDEGDFDKTITVPITVPITTTNSSFQLPNNKSELLNNQPNLWDYIIYTKDEDYPLNTTDPDPFIIEGLNSDDIEDIEYLRISTDFTDSTDLTLEFYAEKNTTLEYYFKVDPPSGNFEINFQENNEYNKKKKELLEEYQELLKEFMKIKMKKRLENRSLLEKLELFHKLFYIKNPDTDNIDEIMGKLILKEGNLLALSNMKNAIGKIEDNPLTRFQFESNNSQLGSAPGLSQTSIKEINDIVKTIKDNVSVNIFTDDNNKILTDIINELNDKIAEKITAITKRIELFDKTITKVADIQKNTDISKLGELLGDLVDIVKEDNVDNDKLNGENMADIIENQLKEYVENQFVESYKSIINELPESLKEAFPEETQYKSFIEEDLKSENTPEGKSKLQYNLELLIKIAQLHNATVRINGDGDNIIDYGVLDLNNLNLDNWISKIEEKQGQIIKNQKKQKSLDDLYKSYEIEFIKNIEYLRDKNIKVKPTGNEEADREGVLDNIKEIYNAKNAYDQYSVLVDKFFDHIYFKKKYINLSSNNRETLLDNEKSIYKKNFTRKSQTQKDQAFSEIIQNIEKLGIFGKANEYLEKNKATNEGNNEEKSFPNAYTFQEINNLDQLENVYQDLIELKRLYDRYKSLLQKNLTDKYLEKLDTMRNTISIDNRQEILNQEEAFTLEQFNDLENRNTRQIYDLIISQYGSETNSKIKNYGGRIETADFWIDKNVQLERNSVTTTGVKKNQELIKLYYSFAEEVIIYDNYFELVSKITAGTFGEDIQDNPPDTKSAGAFGSLDKENKTSEYNSLLDELGNEFKKKLIS